MDSLAYHRLALNLDEERGGGSLDQELVQVEGRFLVLLGGRGKTCDNRAGYFCALAHAICSNSFFRLQLVECYAVAVVNFGCDAWNCVQRNILRVRIRTPSGH